MPLSLLGAAALSKFTAESRDDWRLHGCLATALILQLGFQAETLTEHWLHSPPYRLVKSGPYFRHGPETIEYVAIAENQQQGEFIAPTSGVSNCYDMDDFTRAQIGRPGTSIVKEVLRYGNHDDAPRNVHAQFLTWSHVVLNVSCPTSSNGSSCLERDSGRLQLILQQAYHPIWKAPGAIYIRVLVAI